VTRIRPATEADLVAVCGLLTAENMRTEGVLAPRTRYWVAETAHGIVAALGLELANESGLLRSAVVAKESRGRGIGRDLTQTALQWATVQGCTHVYCFSTEAGGYWLSLGFVECPVAEVVERLPEAPQVLLFRDLGWLPTELAFLKALH
jgi:N-acetylglutamate synthase-like GNAT family acetyltransferase